MSGEATTIARPYAEAIFRRALETDALQPWADMLELLQAIVADAALAPLIAQPKLDRDTMAGLIIEVAGEHLTDEGVNLVRLLSENGRLGILAEIATQFEAAKAQHEGAVDVDIASAFAVDPDDIPALGAALSRKLGREVRVTTRVDETLIGGVLIRAGDTVIDGSIQARLQAMAHELGI